MSLVIAVAYQKGITVIGDTRAKNSKTNMIISESCKKVIRVNNKVLIGFSGTLEPFQKIYQIFYQTEHEHINDFGVEDVANKLSLFAKSLYNDTKCNDNLQIVFAGINSNKKPALINALWRNNFKLDISIVDSNNIIYSVLNPDGFDFSNILEKELSCKSSIRKAIYNTIKYASIQSDTINNRPFGYQILC